MIVKIVQDFFYRFNKVIIIWVVYLVILHLIPFIFHWTIPFNTLEYSFSKYLFGIWSFIWDSSNYLLLSQTGYEGKQAEGLFAFFPGYPIFLKILQFFMNPEYTAKVNSVLILPLLIQFKILLESMNFKEKQINLALIAFLSLPSAFFLNANYTETIYILLTCWGLNSLLRKNLYLSVLIALILSFIKITSVVLVLVIGYYLIKEKFKFNLELKNLIYLVGILILSNLGIFVFFFYLLIEHGNFFLFFKAQEFWGRSLILSESKTTLYNYNDFTFSTFLEIAAFILGSLILYKNYSKIKIELYIFSLLHFLIPIATGTLLSLNRLILFSYPVILFTLANLSKNKLKFWVVVSLMFVLQSVSIYLLMNQHFVG